MSTAPGGIEDHVFENAGDGRYVLALRGTGISLEVDRLRRDRHELVGELAVRCDIAGARTFDGMLSVAKFNLSSAEARKARALVLSQQARGGVDWQFLLESLCQRVLKAERDGDPAVVLSELPPPEDDETFTIDGLQLPSKHGTIIFGDGGTAKSYLQLYIGGTLVKGGLSVMYVDWELDQGTHRGRLERIFGPSMPRVRYARCERPLIYEVDRLHKLIRREQVDYALFDSVGFACEGPPEAAEAALGYFRAVRQLGVGGLHSAHTTKAPEGAEQRPFGSAFWHNSARSTWFAKKTETSHDREVITVGLFNRKSNLGPLQPPIAFELNFSNGSAQFSRVDAASVDELATSLPLPARLRSALRSGPPRTIAALASELGARKDSVEKALRRNTELFVVAPPDEDGVHRYSLLERRVS